MISEFKQIEKLFKEIDASLRKKVKIFVIGGAVLLQQGLKPATKDIDLVIETKEEFMILKNALNSINFTVKIPNIEYKNMNLNQIFIRDDFRIDLFQKEICGRFSISNGMMERAITFIDLEKIKLNFCSNEDIFLFKTMTEREGDLEDCISLAKRGIKWEIILNELKNQIKKSRQDVWITWVGERLDILEEKGVNIPIMKEINQLRERYFKEYEKEHDF
ncbi:hypothetical protein COY26_02840 [Candidatus Woesearchaeota archaeon CG_4_10_14_0_2_um_filter_33_10]|nr:MAG: hypothetical protein AUJ83_02930 [Candidatus Woesearchaeota archaeon CG1_02_33_12]PIN78868.1 MAG: hypothetical protein COV14_01965 [Candidatus Woesearchaeota archaeon CG10_big_fil_rev_8_21_14_0_10_33_12]PIU72102.1 MAG: hypothetical protein COS79_04875 [Candidatus Woesearchaeota archaeon CG06_land_8_20_14_3_00_33_13]PIZ53070.1 MAG: hypothetical protein COY26_02840 [Candidatus Woesearchaeota archaeon CG_4_10_14_0_2_um_filter_33_10]